MIPFNRILSRASGYLRGRFSKAELRHVRRNALGFLKEAGLRVVTASCIISQLGLGFANLPWGSCLAAETAAPVARRMTSGPVSKIEVNRTVPKVEAPHDGLRLSAAPTAQEIFRAHVFAEPLVPVGGEPSAAENSSLASALLLYSQRTSPDDFSSLASFLEAHPNSAWIAALLTNLGLEYYNTAHYSLALKAWTRAWSLAKTATDPNGKSVGDRAAGELAAMYARIGRMAELEALLNSVEDREFVGPATEKISGARAGLSNMKNRPEIAFRCGPLALRQIKLAIDPAHPCDEVFYKSASTQKGFSLPQVQELSKQAGLNFQMAFRESGADLILPAVVHWKVGHYAALVRQDGDRFLLQDATFRNDVWATRQALESETSGYFLIPSGTLPTGWRTVTATEGESVWGRGNVNNNDPGPTGPCDPKKPGNSCPADDQKNSCPAPAPGPAPPPLVGGMTVPSVHLMVVSLNLVDEPVGYSPPVGPAVRFIVTYNQRDAFQPSIFNYVNFGPKWTCQWISYITDNPISPLADVNYYIMGGGTRTFTGLNTNTQTFGFQQYDHTLLTRTGPASYEMLLADGSKRVFGQSDGSIGTARKVFLTQLIDPFGNTVTLTYDNSFRLAAIRDAIGQVTTLSYGNPTDIYKITKVTDPFGRFASFTYDSLGRLTNITDVIGLNSQFTYDGAGDFINTLTTPYGSTLFLHGESGTTRWLETVYPDGERDRVEFNQSTTLGIAGSEPPQSVPVGMATANQYLFYRNTYYWSKTACTLAYGDYTKAKIYHWLHTADYASASGILESTKEPLEGRVWHDYGGQASALVVGTNNLPSHIGRVLDDDTTQLYTYQYDGFGNVTRTVDPVGRTFSSVYDPNGIDLLEARMTRDGASELLEKSTYNAQHLPLTKTDAAGQTTTYTYNTRGQRLTETNPKGGTTTYTYDTNGYLLSVDGPLAGTNDTTSWTYDAFGRIRTKTDESGYTVTSDYDALNRPTRITFPDSTFDLFSYSRLDQTLMRDRAARETAFEFNSVGQLTKRTDSLGRATRFQWCKCGDNKSLTDPQGRTTSWHHDVEGRVTDKQWADGSKITYIYENTTGRLKQVIDENRQVIQYSYNPDDTLAAITYANTQVPTPSVFFTYDRSYERLTSMTDGIGTTVYTYIPVTTPPSLGAAQLASVSGPLPNAQIRYGYDEFGRRVSTSVGGTLWTKSFDAAGRVSGQTNALGICAYSYEGPSARLLTAVFPNGQTSEMAYGGNLEDDSLKRITYWAGAAPVSEFLYEWDIPAGRITSWSQQAESQAPSVLGLAYDSADQLTSIYVTNSGAISHRYAYTYDLSANRLTEQIDGSTNAASYNALNQIATTTLNPGKAVTNEWDGEHRLSAVNVGSQRTELSYDGRGRLVGVRQLTNATEISHRLFLWSEDRIVQELAPDGRVTKQFFDQGVKVETGPSSGQFYYTVDHLGSVREMTDSAGKVRARYVYDAYGRRSRILGDQEADFGFAGKFIISEAGLLATRFRMYDPENGRWLSRDPLKDAEIREGYNLYAYVANNPINKLDQLGLCCEDKYRAWSTAFNNFINELKLESEQASLQCSLDWKTDPNTAVEKCGLLWIKVYKDTLALRIAAFEANNALEKCIKTDPSCSSGGCHKPPRN